MQDEGGPLGPLRCFLVSPEVKRRAYLMNIRTNVSRCWLIK